MQQNTQIECPNCSRPLQKFNGHIGYCSQHKWVSPFGLGYEAEAAEQNRLDIAAAEKKRLDEERKIAEVQAQEIQEQHRSTIRKLLAGVLAVGILAGAAVFFVVRPSINYSSAVSKFTSGEYESAQKAFIQLGDYKDAPSRAILCGALFDLQAGHTEDAITKLDQLSNTGQDAIAVQLIDALLPVVTDWQKNGLSPESALLLLDKMIAVNPDCNLDVSAIWLECHTALLNGAQLDSFAEDVTHDGDDNLVVLNPDYSVSVYRMTIDGNILVSVDNDTISKCVLSFGNRIQENDLDAAIACFAEAYRLLPSNETRSVLSAAYQDRAILHENNNDMDAAIADARNALDVSGTSDNFRFFYEINLRHCTSSKDTKAAIALWDEFAVNNSIDLVRYSANEQWQSDAAQLHVAYASELASQENDGCIDEFRTALHMGADITDALSEAASLYKPGIMLAQLRLVEIELHNGDAAKVQQIRDTMAEEVNTAIREWKNRGIAAVDVPPLIYLADQQGIDLSGVNREEVYDAAALATVVSNVQSCLVDWDADGYKELLALDPSGNLVLYGIGETWSVRASIDTKIANGFFAITDETAPLIIVISEENDEMLAVTGTSANLRILFRESGICRYAMNGTTVTFSRLLEGSIERYHDYTFEAVGTLNKPIRTSVDWQQSDYPQPVTAADAVQRYFEARAYGIPEEAAFLTKESEADALFRLPILSALPDPEVPGTVNAAAYQTEDDKVLFEVTYPSGTQSVRTWVAAQNVNGWKLTGASDTFGTGQDGVDIDYSVELMSLNAESRNTLAAKGSRNTYRIMVPAAGRLKLVWQSGTSSASRTSHTVAMYQGTLAGKSVFAFDLQPSVNKQQSKDMFVAPGVYYVTVEAKIADTSEYTLMLSFDPETNVELENNDVASAATPVALNAGYSGTLSDAKDIDYFSFALEETSAVDVTLGALGDSSRSTVYTYSVFHAADGSILTSVSVPGNSQLTGTGNLYLSPGTYLVKVEKGSTYTNNEYTLTVNASQNGIMEFEANNTPETANVIPVNEDIHASFGQEGDVDCYVFTLGEDSVVQPRFTFKPTDSSSKTYVLTLMDASRHELLNVKIGGKESTKVIAPVALAAGTYTVKIENPRFVRQDYTLHLASAAVKCAEAEPNHSAALATELQVGAERTGVLTSESDIDYYQIVFPEQATVTFRFSFPQSADTSTAYVLTIEQNGKKQWSANIKGDAGLMEQQLMFSAGEYYIKVAPSKWLGAVYTIAMNQQDS